jgi:single-strand DNA-binding protein
MNEIHVTLRGNVATDPRYTKFRDGSGVTSFRLATTSRYFDRERDVWVSRETTYLTVNCRRWLAENTHASLVKGQPVVVTGRMRERSWETEDRNGRTIEVDALTVGHDLAYGEAKYTRVVRSEPIRTSSGGSGSAPAEEREPVDLTGLPVVGAAEAPEPEDDEEEDVDVLENAFEEMRLAETVSA